jgi:ATP synthase protein I
MASPKSNPKKTSGSMQALIKAEKLTQIAFVLPVSALVGWGLGALLDRFFHQHWIYLAGLILGVVAGFFQIFRMIAEPGLLASTTPDPSAPKGPGFKDDNPS